MALGYPRPFPSRMLLLTDDLQDRGCCRQGEQGWSSLPGEELSTAQRGQGMSPSAHQSTQSCHHSGGTFQTWWMSPDSRVSSALRVPVYSWGKAGYPAQADCRCECRDISLGHFHPQRHPVHRESFRNTEGLFYTEKLTGVEFRKVVSCAGRQSRDKCTVSEEGQTFGWTRRSEIIMRWQLRLGVQGTVCCNQRYLQRC